MHGIQKLEVIEMIKTKTVVGTGTKEDPVREEIQYWGKDGRMLFKEGSQGETRASASRKANSESM